MNWRFLIPWLHALAFWPLAGWYVRRMTDPADEPWGLLALGCAGLFLWLERGRVTDPARPDGPAAKRRVSLLPAAWITLVYVLAYPVLPPLVRGGLAMAALACSISACWLGRRLHAGLLGLLLLSLPVMLSFEYYAGYPLRLAVSWVAARLLVLCGLAVRSAGGQLEWGAIRVVVDAPCAGIRFLWVGACLTLTLACLFRLGARRTMLAGVMAFLLVLAGNVARTTALFLVESGILAGPSWWHTALGLMAFAGVAVGIALLVLRLAPGPATASARTRMPPLPPVWPLPMVCPGKGLLKVACLLAALAPCLPDRKPDPVAGFPGWPQTFEGRRLIPQAMSERESRFERTFPGRSGKFHDGQRVVVLRWIGRPSRQLHPIETCFKGQGYKVTPEPLFVDGGGNWWGAFQALRGGERVRVRTRILDSSGRAWQDVSSWFWSAVLRKTEGPWWVVTVVERQPELAVVLPRMCEASLELR